MSRQITVAMIIQDYLSHVGGAQGQLASLGPFLQAHNVKVSVITRRYPGLATRDVVDDVDIFRIGSPGKKNFASASFTLMALPVLKRIEPDIVHVHGLLSPLTTGLAGKRLTGVPLVAKVLRGGNLGDLHRLKTKLFNAARIEWMRKSVDTFLEISDEIDRELADIGISARRRERLPNGVDTYKFSPVSETEKRSLRKYLNLPEDGLICVYTGRLVVEKQVHHLIQVCEQLHPELLLLILGSGPQADTLRDIASQNVRFIGFTDQVDVYLKAADVFVLPSSTEGLSNAMLEAKAAGLAVVATNVGGAPDVIEHGVNGWLVNPEATDSLKAGLREVLRDDELRRTLGTSARQKMVEEFAFPVIARRMRQVYDRLLDSHSVAVTNN